MMIRSLLATTVGASLLLLGGAASDPVLPNEPWLELPRPASAWRSIVPSHWPSPRLYPAASAAHSAGGSRVNYGTIHTKVNTESADVAMMRAPTA